MNRIIKPPIGNQLSCKNWQIEAAYRMIQHNLDQNVAENPDELIVYGGKGKAARNWECYESILVFCCQLVFLWDLVFLKICGEE